MAPNAVAAPFAATHNKPQLALFDRRGQYGREQRPIVPDNDAGRGDRRRHTDLLRQDDIARQPHSENTFGDINQTGKNRPAFAHGACDVGAAHIAAANLEDVDVPGLSHEIGGRERADQIAHDDTSDDLQGVVGVKHVVHLNCLSADPA